ncbi:MAG TPA: hypothetical protein VFV38_02190, partial [Ktedonobacteraceae bacterium]|nr:hypothetical protein [Ktedonobacteraceae bacterium]
RLALRHSCLALFGWRFARWRSWIIVFVGFVFLRQPFLFWLALQLALTLYNDAYPGGIGLPPGLDHIPGEYNLFSWALFWIL